MGLFTVSFGACLSGSFVHNTFLKEKITMKKFVLFAMAAALCLSMLIVPVSAGANRDAALKWTPVIDGKIDEAYLQSISIDHEFPSVRSSENYWGSGKFAFTDAAEGVVGYNTAYGWDAAATSYILWDDTSVYVAVRVTDDDVTGVSDAKYAEAVADLGDYGLWLTDQITCYLTYKGMTSTIRVEALGRYGAEWDGDGYEGWVDWARWHSQDPNREDGLYAVSYTSYGYIVEMKLPLNASVAPKLLKDGGKFDYGLSICDIPLNFEYGLHQGKLAEGIEEYGFNVNDFMMMNDVGTYGGGKYKIKLSEQTPDTSKFITPDGAGTNESTGTKPAGASTAAGGAGAAAGGAAATGDTGIIVAAATLLAAGAFIAIKKHR